MSDRIRLEHSSMIIRDLVEDFDSQRFLIPPHQREYRWTLNQQKKLIISVLKGYPIPLIVMSKENGIQSIEDGRQRMTTLSRYKNDMFGITWPIHSGLVRKYSQLTEEERAEFNRTNVQLSTFSGATPEQRVEIFDFLQNGSPLTAGERYHAQYASPLVSYTLALLLKPGERFYDRATVVWGERSDYKDKKYTGLLNAIALVLGLLYGPAYANKTYDADKGFITNEITDQMKADVEEDLDRILDTFEQVDLRVPATKPNSWLKPQWDYGNMTGYFVYSLSILDRNKYELDGGTVGGTHFEDEAYKPNSLKDKPEEWSRIQSVWIDYLCSVRTIVNESPKTKLISVLERKIHKGGPKSRNWNNTRWSNGYNRVFGLMVSDDTSDEDI
jgi:hypothetical protein